MQYTVTFIMSKQYNYITVWHNFENDILYGDSEWLLLNTKLRYFQPYHDEESYILTMTMMMISTFFLNQHAELDFYSVSSLKQHFVCRHVASLEHINMISS